MHKQANRRDKMKLGYYPILDMLLGVREIYAVERFMPLPYILDSIKEKLSDSDKELLLKIGDKTHGWLHVIETVIDLIKDGITNSEEMLVYLSRNSSIIKGENLKEYEQREIAFFIINLWQNYFSNEIARWSKVIFENVLEISKSLEEESLIDYLTKKTDRVVKVNDNELKVLIKPEHTIKDIETAIVMPSIFTSRRFVFWNSGNNYVFYISMESEGEKNIEPSDMLLIKVSALNDKTRLKMLKILSSGSRSAMEIAQMLNLNASTVSRHFKLFKDAGFVNIFSQEGNLIYYSIDENEIKSTMELIFDYIKGEGGTISGN